MLYALVEGLAGIEDKRKLFQKCCISPRWFAAAIIDAEVRVCYESSGAEIGYSIRYEKDRIHLGVQAIGSDCQFHVLLPDKMQAKTVSIDGRNVGFNNQKIRSSNYVDFASRIENKTSFLIRMEE
jgi:hypothetical protein